MTSRLGVTFWLVLALGAALAVPAFMTYPNGGSRPWVSWTVGMVYLVWRVHCRSNLTRIVFAVIAAVGLMLHALGSITDGSRDNAVLIVLYCIQLAAMLAPPVKAWTRRSRSVRVPESVTAS
jgi:hypothetical protein